MMAEAFFVKEFDRCPECKSTLIIQDNNTGETVCGNCGVVLGEVEFAPPPERIPRVEPRSHYGLTTFAVGTVPLSSLQKTESNIMHNIDRIFLKAWLPSNLKPTAVWYMEKLLKAMRRQKGSIRRKLTVREIAVFSVWHTIKAAGVPMGLDEYASKVSNALPEKYTAGDILRLEVRAKTFASVPSKFLEPTEYVARLVSKLEGEVEYAYLNLVAGYATRLIKENRWVGIGRKPMLAAAAALQAADDLLAGKIDMEKLAEASGSGTSTIRKIAERLKKEAPAVPERCASVRLRKTVEVMYHG